MPAVDIVNKCPVLLAFNSAGYVVPLWCGQWECSYCRLRLSQEYAAICRYGIAHYEPEQSYMWTLTLGSSYMDRRKGFAALPKLWDTFRKGVQRAIQPDKWQYFTVVEGQPKRDSMPHFHIVTPILFPVPTKRKKLESMIKDYAVQCGFGYQAHQRKVSGAEGARYVAKYLAKGGGTFPKGARRIRISREWPKSVAESAPLAADLIVWQRGEHLQDYLIRAANELDLPLQLLADRYIKARQTFSKVRTGRSTER